jgi:vesicular inhibitory amino acid transporter
MTETVNLHGSSTSRTVLNIVMTSVGVSIYTLPKCFSASGALMSTFLLILSTIVTGFCMTILGKTTSLRPDLKSYPDIGKAAFGTYGMVSVQLCMYAGLTLICGAMLMLMGDSLNGLLYPDSTAVSVTFKAVCALGLLPLVMLPSFKEIGIVSIAGMVGITVALVAAVVAAFANMSDSSSETQVSSSSSFLAHAETFALIMNGFCVSPAIPALAAGIKYRKSFPRAVGISMFVIAVMFAVVGFCYLGFGTIEGDLLKSITGQESLKTYAKIIQIGTLTMCVSHFLCLFAPIAMGLDGVMTKVMKGSENRLVRLSGLAFGRTLGVACCFGLAANLKNFGQLIGIVATTVVPFLQVFFPVAFYLSIARSENVKLGRGFMYSMIAAMFLGLAYAVIGFILLVKEMSS